MAGSNLVFRFEVQIGKHLRQPQQRSQGRSRRLDSGSRTLVLGEHRNRGDDKDDYSSTQDSHRPATAKDVPLAVLADHRERCRLLEFAMGEYI